MKSAASPERTGLVRKAAVIALCGNLVLALLKITTGLVTGSLAVVGDGIDSSTDVVIAVNLADHWSQGYVPLPFPDFGDRTVVLDDRLGPARYERAGDDLRGQGLYLDVAPWAHHAFSVTAS